MNEFKEGDKVRAVAIDGTVIEGIVGEASTSGAWVAVRGVPLTLRFDGWELSLVERAQPELPTEPGWYLDCYENVCHLAPEDAHYEARWFNEWGLFTIRAEMAECAPFTRLEPVADTAKKVLDAVRGFVEARSIPMHDNGVTMFHRASFMKDLDGIAEEFGVSNV